MQTKEELQKKLHRLDGKGYKRYQEIKGNYSFPLFTLFIDHVQKDPFASPSRLRVRIPQNKAAISSSFYNTKSRLTAAEDYLTRNFGNYLTNISNKRAGSGSGKSGVFSVNKGGQEILERTSMVINQNYVEARFSAGLPAKGRTILGHSAEEMLCEWLPEAVKRTLISENIDLQDFETHINVNEDQDHLRAKLKEKGLIGFVADGSILPRESGISDKPLQKNKAVLFKSPPELETEIHLPHRGKIKGMGIPEGITLIVGGGYHGKSTLLRALERGVYNHIPGDGREYIVTVEDAVKIRAEDGRRVCKVNISPFIDNLPMKIDTTTFFSEDASGSTSQAANIIEALEIGTSLLLLDEDTSATNFMIRDERMQRLVEKNKEPITPFLDKVRDIYRDLGISTVIVMGGSGDYFDASDTVIMMDHYYAYDVTGDAKRVAEDYPRNRASEGGEGFGELTPRIVGKKGLDPVKGKKKKISAKGLYNIQYGAQNLSLFYLEQLVDAAQTRAIGDIINYVAEQYINESITLKKAIDLAFHDIYEKGLDVISPFYGEHPGDYSLPRPQEVAGAFNRLRSLHIK